MKRLILLTTLAILFAVAFTNAYAQNNPLFYHKIEGYVTYNGLPVSNVTVTINFETSQNPFNTLSAVTNSNGKYSIWIPTTYGGPVPIGTVYISANPYSMHYYKDIRNLSSHSGSFPASQLSIHSTYWYHIQLISLNDGVPGIVDPGGPIQ